MSKVITFSRTFPAYHPKAGQPTYFVEKFYNSIYRNGSESMEEIGRINQHLPPAVFMPFLDSMVACEERKHHTIRAGHNWKVGDKFSPRVWSGRPYNSKQVVIAPDVEIKKVWDIEIKEFSDGRWIDFGNYKISEHMAFPMTVLPLLARNDGLELQDLLDWFKFPKPFTGQILCWNENINY